MDPPGPVVLRQRVLTNSAAEFVERRMNFAALRQLEENPEEIRRLQDASEFVPEFDKFTHKGITFDPTTLYKQSPKHMVTFRQTLQRLVVILKDRNVDIPLDISIEKPSNLTIDGVLKIVNKIEEGRNNSAKIRSCKNFIRRCYRKVEDNRDVIGTIITMLPTDSYGSLISGGFTLIMVAVEKHAERREAIHNFLAEIPERLEKIERLRQLHHTSARLHECLDAVMVAIFVALTSIIDKLTSKWTNTLTNKLVESAASFKKTMSRFQSKSNGQKQEVDIGIEGQGMGEASDEDDQRQNTDVTDALAELQSQIQRFQGEVDLCDKERWGRIETHVGNVEDGLVWATRQHARMMEKSLEEVKNFIVETAKKTKEETKKELLLEAENCFYRLFTSNPIFNAKTGEIDYEEARLLQQEKEAASIRSREKKNSRIATKWCRSLQDLTYDPTIDMKYCLEHIEQLEQDEKDIAKYILDSEEFNAWLQEGRSRIIDINLQTPPSSLVNPLSFHSALLVATLQSTALFPVLAFFTMHRSNEDPSESGSGPAALVKSLNGQLLKFIAAHRPLVELSALADQKLLSKAKSTLKDGLKLMEALILSLPEDDMVFFVIDSLSRLMGDEKDGDKVFKKLHGIIKKRKDIVIKVMVTDTLVDSYVKSIVDIPFYCQDLVSGFGVIDATESGNEITRQVNLSRDAKRRDKDSEMSDEDNEDDSEQDQDNHDSDEDDDEDDED
ncbi:hypothetical protein F5B20DRAFT_528212 [Whalleya microplaca]|nr:hypothetical protein F5B20DRAFT_528212 [Whalleya microplaca]